SFDGSTCTWICRSCWPKMATLETPATPAIRGLTTHRARYDSSSGLSVGEFSPINITRAVEDIGWISCGGLDTLGSENALVSRSSTSWRACSVEVPGSKYKSTVDSPGIDCERTSQTSITPSSRLFSSGTVTYCSTSWLESPRASVWTSSTGP